MLGCFFILLSLWIGFIVEDKIKIMGPFFWAKLSCAVIIGTMLSTWLVLLIAFLCGFTVYSLVTSLAVMACYSVYEKACNGRGITWFVRNIVIHPALSPTHILLLLFIMPFFVWGVWETAAGDIVYRGNYTDLPYHLSIISAFLEQNRFLPDNPQCTGALMSYHFMVNFHSAILCRGGFSLLASVVVPQVLFSFALASMIYFFFRTVLTRKADVFFSSILLAAGHIASFNLLFAAMGYPPPGMHLDIVSWPVSYTHLRAHET